MSASPAPAEPLALEGFIPAAQVDPARHLVRVPGGEFHRVTRHVQHPSGMWVICTPEKEWAVPSWSLVQVMDRNRAAELRAEAVEWAEGH